MRGSCGVAAAENAKYHKPRDTGFSGMLTKLTMSVTDSIFVKIDRLGATNVSFFRKLTT